MRDVLKQADLTRGEINDVPMGTMYGLERRELITSEWRKARTKVRCITGGGSFPWFSGVPLTVTGLRAARSVQGLRADF